MSYEISITPQWRSEEESAQKSFRFKILIPDLQVNICDN